MLNQEQINKVFERVRNEAPSDDEPGVYAVLPPSRRIREFLLSIRGLILGEALLTLAIVIVLFVFNMATAATTLAAVAIGLHIGAVLGYALGRLRWII